MSTRGREYKEAAKWRIFSQGRYEQIKGDVSLFIRAYPPDKRKRDIDNILKPLLDVLTTAGIYKDDSQVTDLRIQKFNPSKPGRVEVMVSSNDL